MWTRYSTFPVSPVTSFSFRFIFNYSPIKINQFEGHFMKLQADSNYLLSKEYEVLLGPSWSVGSPSVESPLECHYEISWDAYGLRRAHIVSELAPGTAVHLFSEASLSSNHTANIFWIRWWDGTNKFQRYVLSSSAETFACLGNCVAWTWVPRLWAWLSTVSHACPAPPVGWLGAPPMWWWEMIRARAYGRVGVP